MSKWFATLLVCVVIAWAAPASADDATCGKEAVSKLDPMASGDPCEQIFRRAAREMYGLPRSDGAPADPESLRPLTAKRFCLWSEQWCSFDQIGKNTSSRLKPIPDNTIGAELRRNVRDRFTRLEGYGEEFASCWDEHRRKMNAMGGTLKEASACGNNDGSSSNGGGDGNNPGEATGSIAPGDSTSAMLTGLAPVELKVAPDTYEGIRSQLLALGHKKATTASEANPAFEPTARPPNASTANFEVATPASESILPQEPYLSTPEPPRAIPRPVSLDPGLSVLRVPKAAPDSIWPDSLLPPELLTTVPRPMPEWLWLPLKLREALLRAP